jgi:Cu2+-exporting ATPase
MKSKIDFSSGIKADTTIENEIVINVEGMMCEHCEKRVKDCLEALDEIDIAVSDYKSGTVKLTLSGEADLKKIKKVISAAGYKMK